ncbi:MAG: hypothetical protein FJ224_01085 [Lentisphaerae bacterium]|nr:hypothetical protein [Lentisphaerota bacterium]
MFLRKPASDRASGLRTRFVPRSRIAQGLFGAAPWADVVLLVIFFLLVGWSVSLQPGLVVNLHPAPFTDGTPLGRIAVILPGPGQGTAEPGDEMVFFDDERFRLGSPAQCERLRQMFARAAAKQNDMSLIVVADRNIRHGTVLQVLNMALEAGIPRANLAERAE